MVELFIHHNGSINFVSGTYTGGDISYIGKKDPDYLSLVVFYKFVREDLGYLNVTRLAWKFDEAARPFKLLESDDDCRHLSMKICKEQSKELHVYVEHYIDTTMFTIVEAANVEVDEDENDVEDEVEEVNLGGADDTELEDEDDMAGEDVREDPPEIFSDFVYSEEEQPELYPTVENEDEAVVARRNVISWFGSAHSVSRQIEEAPDSRGEDSDDGDSMSEGANEGYDSQSQRTRFPEFHEEDLEAGRRIKLEKGLKFRDMNLFRRALITFSIQNGFAHCFVKNDTKRVTAKCKGTNCNWRIHVSAENERGGFMIKTFHQRHRCGTHYSNKHVNAKWVAKQYLEKIRDSPRLTTTALIEEVRRDWMVGISKHTAYRALKLALEMVNGKHHEQYNHVYDYAAAVYKWNPGSAVIIYKDPPHFKRMYVRLKACKAGFLAGCRPMISVDACHLKGPFGGQLFCAVAKDGNEDMFPIAFAVCENECRASWCWFLDMLIDDVGAHDSRRWVFISDRQKGLLDAFDILMPDTEHRFCIKHLHANMKSKNWKGQAYKDILWKCAKATTEVSFNQHMNEMMGLSPVAHLYLSKINPKCWSRHAFSTHSKSDVLLNNIAETFNSWVLEARDKPILSMLEIIRRMLMNRFYFKREGAKEAKFDICPRIQAKLEKNKELGSHYICRWGNGVEFEVDHHTEERRVVNIPGRSCTCGKWQLNCIPCPHAVSAIYFARLQPEDLVDDYYRLAAYARTYLHDIEAMPDPEGWTHVEVDPTLPPVIQPRPGRPRKSRRRAEDEPPPPPHRVSRRGYVAKCGRCGARDHNRRRCKLPPKPGERKYPPKPYTKKTRTDGAGTSTGIEIPTNRNREITGTSELADVGNAGTQVQQSQQSMRVSTELQPPDRVVGRRARGVQRTRATQ